MVRVALKDVDKPGPCKWCFPDVQWAPPTYHELCKECPRVKVRPYPCEHNGGVKVAIKIKGRKNPSMRYVWPEKAWLYA